MNKEKVLQERQTKNARLSRLNYLQVKQTKKSDRLTRINYFVRQRKTHDSLGTNQDSQGDNHRERKETPESKYTGKHSGNGWKTTFWQRHPLEPGLEYG